MTEPKKFEYERKLKKDNKILHFIYKGLEPKKTIDYRTISVIINNLPKILNTYDDMIKNIAWIRLAFGTFGDIDEEYLKVEIISDNKKEEVIYEKNELKTYETKVLLEDKEVFDLKYEPKDGTTFSNPTSDILTQKEFVELLSNESKKISNLKALQEIKRESILIIEAYELFYNEKPSFRKSDIGPKLKELLLTLNSLDIYLCESLNFDKSRKDYHMLILSKTLGLINNLAPLGEINTLLLPNTLSSEKRKIINYAGGEVRKNIVNEETFNKLI